VFVQHTSASLAIQENADPDVVARSCGFFRRLAPENDPRYRHKDEGPDDMPAHIRSTLTGTSLTIPVVEGAWRWGRGRGFIYSSIVQQRTGEVWYCI